MAMQQPVKNISVLTKYLILNLLLQSLVCLNGDVIRRETIAAMPAGNAKFLMDSVFELAQRINRFRLSDAEIGLFCSVVIISAGTGLCFKFFIHLSVHPIYISLNVSIFLLCIYLSYIPAFCLFIYGLICPFIFNVCLFLYLF